MEVVEKMTEEAVAALSDQTLMDLYSFGDRLDADEVVLLEKELIRRELADPFVAKPQEG